MRPFKKFLKEMNAAGAGGVFGIGGATEAGIGNADSYATGDARVPTVLGTYTRKGKLKTKIKKNKK
jgi:hypothetical protein